MPASKKRKLEPAAIAQPQVMSAVALRKLRQQNSTPSEATRATESPVAAKKATRSSTSFRKAPVAPVESEDEDENVAVSPDRNGNEEASPAGAAEQIKPSASSRAAESRPSRGDSQWSRIIQHSTFTPTEANYKRQKNGSILLDMPEGERLVILGSYGVTVKQGSITIAGATIRKSEGTHWLHSSYSCSLPVLRCAEETQIILQSHPASSSFRELEKLSPMFGRHLNDLHSGEHDDTFKIIYTSADGPKRAILQDLVSPAEWNREIATVARSKDVLFSVTLICGPKSSGKSTFARQLVNRLVTDHDRARSKSRPGVAILDIDPGQPEFTTPGHLSLLYLTEPNLSPPFCHPLVTGKSGQVIRSHAIATVSPTPFDTHYTDCVIDLVEVFRKELRGKCPLVVNTSGWVQGTGLDILVELITKIRPTKVFYMSRDGPEDAVTALRTATGSSEFAELPSQPSAYMTRTALHLRSMQTMSYFHLDLKNGKDGSISWDPQPLTSRPPWRVRYTGSHRGIFGIVGYDDHTPAELLRDAIAGTVMSVVEIEDPAAFCKFGTSRRPDESEMDVDQDEGSQPDTRDYKFLESSLLTLSPEGLPLLENSDRARLDPRHSRYIGSVLVRGINTESKELELLTPLPLRAFNSVLLQDRRLVLVYGKLDAPTWAYAEDLHNIAAESTATRESDGDTAPEPTEEDTDDDASERDEAADAGPSQHFAAPWVVTLHGNQTRGVGSKVWRVRRDLGRRGNALE